MRARARTAVLVSGRGSNLQALIDACADSNYPSEIVCVISNVAGVEAIVRAERARIPVRTIAHGSFETRPHFDAAIESCLNEFDVHFVCLAGFMRILSEAFVQNWRGRLINVHPSLLPAFKGLDVHRRVLESGVRISGCTVHFVVPELDSGPIIAQAAVPVLAQDSEETLARRVLAAEHRIYPLALRLLAEKRAQLEGNRVVLHAATCRERALFSPELQTTEPERAGRTRHQEVD